ncbi:MAG TPA: WG repeat-containing protein, partial [Lachnospiraceae bacterium]|nr:WG repeat-containing protein [Lachnospiraceae bacterium]
MKKTLLTCLFIFWAFIGCSCADKPRDMTSAVKPNVSPDSRSDVPGDAKSLLQSAQKLSVAVATGIRSVIQPTSLVTPTIITPDSTTDEIVYAANSEGILCIYDGKKYGFIAEEGNEVTPFIYDKAHPFSEGKACVYSNGKYGFIDSNGDVALPFIYDKASSFHDGLAYFEVGDQYGFIDKNGNQVVLLNCDSVSSFNEGLAYFSIDGKYGYIDKTGNEVISPIYDDAGYFNNGYAKVRIFDKVGIISKSGREVVSIDYDDVSMDEGFFITQLDEKYGCTNGKGEIILPPKYDFIYVDQGTINYSINDKCKIIDANGNAIETKYSSISKVPNSNFSIAVINDKYGIVDLADKVIVPFEYDWIYSWDYGSKNNATSQVDTYTTDIRFSVKLGEKYGVIDENGTFIIPCEYEDIQLFSNGMITLTQNGKCSLADKNGRIVSNDKYDYITQVGDFFSFEKDNRYGFLNRKGEEVISQTYDYITYYYNDIYNSNTCFVATNYGTGYSDSIVVTKLGSNDDISSLILENMITPKIKSFNNYTKNLQVDIPFSENSYQMNDMIKTFRLYKLAGSDTPILYAYTSSITPQNFEYTYSGFFSQEHSKVTTLITASECGGSMGGDYVCLGKDNETSKIVITTSSHMGGFGGNACGS